MFALNRSHRTICFQTMRKHLLFTFQRSTICLIYPKIERLEHFKKTEFVSPLLNTLGQMDRKRQTESFPLCFWFCLDFIDVRILWGQMSGRQRAGETVILSFLNFIFLLFCLMRTEGGAWEIKRETKTVFHWCCSVKLSWHSIFTTYCNAAADLCVRERERGGEKEREGEKERGTKRQKEEEKAVKQRTRSTLKSETDRKHTRERERDWKKENVFVSPVSITQHACLSVPAGWCNDFTLSWILSKETTTWRSVLKSRPFGGNLIRTQPKEGKIKNCLRTDHVAEWSWRSLSIMALSSVFITQKTNTERLSFCTLIMCFFCFPEYTQLEHDFVPKVKQLDIWFR